MKTFLNKFSSLVLILLLLCSPCYGQDYYVDNATGNDGNAGTLPGAGNAWLTIQYAADTIVAGDRAWIKEGTTYTLAAQVDFDTNAGSLTSPIKFIGYGTVTGDSVQPRIEGAINAFFYSNKAYIHIYNFDMYDPTLYGMQTGASGDGNTFKNLKIDLASIAIAGSGSSMKIIDCEIKNSSGDGFDGAGGTFYFDGNTFISNGGHGIDSRGTAGLIVKNSIIADNGSNGINNISGYVTITNNIIDGNTGSGISDVAADYMVTIKNNIISNHTTAATYGINWGAQCYDAVLDNNAYYNNTVGDVRNVLSGDSKVLLTGTPYVDSANGDFRLNTTVGGGEDCHDAGAPTTLSGDATRLDIGAYQSNPATITFENVNLENVNIN